MATPTINYNPSAPFERDDIELVKMFLAGFKDENGCTYKLKVRPDVAERKEKAIEAIAESEDGRTLAIEHTYIQPFEGERADAVPFQTVFEQLRTDSEGYFRFGKVFRDNVSPFFMNSRPILDVGCNTGVRIPVAHVADAEVHIDERARHPESFGWKILINQSTDCPANRECLGKQGKDNFAAINL
jgi:hypothetical protein